jgi:hypothetical protein
LQAFSILSAMPGSGPSTGSGRTGGVGFGAKNLRFLVSNWQIYFSGSTDWLLPDRTIVRSRLARDALFRKRIQRHAKDQG